MKNGIATIQSNDPRLVVDNLLEGGLLGNNLAQSMFTALIEYDEGFTFLLNTRMSRDLRAMRDASLAGDNVPIFRQDSETGKLYLENIPKMSFSPMTAEEDSCCVVAGDLQVCKDSTELKMFCLKKCKQGIAVMAEQIGVAGSNSAVYSAYKQILLNSGIPKKALPTLEEFEQLSLIAQFVVLNMLTFLNGLLDTEQNGNIVKRFSGLSQVYTNPDVYTIDGSLGVLNSFKEASVRMHAVGKRHFRDAFFLADRVGFSAIRSEIVKKADGNYPTGWYVRTEERIRDGFTYYEDVYYFEDIRIVESELAYIDSTSLDGNIHLVPRTVGIFSAVPLDMNAKFIYNEFNNSNSAFVHFEEGSENFPDCWSACTSLTNMGAVVSTESNLLLSITNIKSEFTPKVLNGIEGLINVNSYAPFIK
ncbi:MAG: hypothetical protein [Caudoviricetes sp.]|nr:MAG: hypothetical protein [Caudoviricetes sp.]